MLGTLKYRLLLLESVRASKQMPLSSWAALQWLAHHIHHENAFLVRKECLTSLEQSRTWLVYDSEHASANRAI